MSEQQPECPEEFAWMKPGAWAQTFDFPPQKYFICQEPTKWTSDWVALVSNTESKRSMHTYLRCDDLEPSEAPVKKQSKKNAEIESLRARLEEAEAREEELTAENERLTNSNGEVWKWSCEVEFESKQLKSKLAQVKALLDGVGSVVDWVRKTQRAEDIQTLLSAITEAQEVLKGAN